MSDDDRSVLQPIVGSAAYAGSYAAADAGLVLPAAKLYQMARGGSEITSGAGTPLARIAEFSREEVKAIKAFAAERGVKVPILASGARDLSYFHEADSLEKKILDGARRVVGAPAKPWSPSHIGLGTTDMPTAFHEIGHASGKRKLMKAMHGMSVASGGTPGHLLRLGLLGHAITEPKEDATRTRRFLHENAPALVAGSYAPQLAEELRATTGAVRGARRHGVGALKSLKVLLPALGSYAGSAAAPVIATVLAQRIVHALRDRAAAKEEQEKTSAAKQGVEVKSSGALRTPASAAWRIGGRTPPKPKSIKPNTHELGAPAKTRMAAKPPSNKDYFKDTLESLYNPGRGHRLGIVS